jgi:Skp family chaperone for outer membrane proteins
MLPNEYVLEKLSDERQAEWEQLIQDQHVIRTSNQEVYENKKAPKGSSLFQRLNPFIRNIAAKKNDCELSSQVDCSRP